MRYDRNAIEEAARGWWGSLQPPVGGEDRRKFPGDRATLAKLRRAGDPLVAAAEPATIQLYKHLELLPVAASDAHKGEVLARVAVLASVLAHVRDDSAQKVGRALGPAQGAKNGEGGVMTPLRLARLLAARGDEEIGTAFRRAVALLDDTANVGDLAWLILTWDRDEIGDRTRTLFAFAYHDASAHAPSESTSSADAATTANT